MSHSAVVVASAIAVVDGKPTTTSIEVVRHFGKQHRNVLQAIQNLIPQLDAERALNSQQMVVDVQIGGGAARKDAAYQLARDGFTLLAMGFTGKKALQFKLAYIDAFNRMEATIAESTHTPERVDLAYAQATAVAEQAARAVFSAVMAGQDDDWRSARWLFCLSPTGQPQVLPVAPDAMVLRLVDLPRQMMEPGTSPSNRELVELAAACNQRLAQRMAHDARGLLN